MYSTPLEGATAEAEDPGVDLNPGAPASSRVSGDPFVHYISEIDSGRDVIRFWFPETCDSDPVPVDYEVLQPNIRWIGGSWLRLNEDNIYRLIILVFFQEYTDDFYRDKINSFSFGELGTNKFKLVGYPSEKLVVEF